MRHLLVNISAKSAFKFCEKILPSVYQCSDICYVYSGTEVKMAEKIKLLLCSIITLLILLLYFGTNLIV